MGKALFNASEGDGFDMSREWEDVTQNEPQQVSGMQVLIRLNVRAEAIRTAFPCPYSGIFCNGKVKKEICDGESLCA